MKAVFFVGATGVGKSHIAARFADRFSAALVNADSVQMYERLNIGSAKPSAEERARLPHYLFDFVKPPEAVTAGEFNRHFFAACSAELEKKFPTIFVVGGTGFYFQAIERGLLPIPPADFEFQKTLLQRIETEGAEILHRELAEKDPTAAARIHVHDHYRITRALDIIHATGRPVTEILETHAEQGPRFPYPLLKMGLRRSRDELLEVIEKRTTEMLQGGWLEEVEGLLNEGYRDWEPLRSVGYKQCVEFLSSSSDRGSLSMQRLHNEIVKETMKLAKKQRTWFQRDLEIQWFHPSETKAIESVLERFMEARKD